MLAKQNIKTDLGNFIKNDTIYYPNGQILRTSEAKNGYLNGSVIYYNEKGGLYLNSKWKNGEHSDTSVYYNIKGVLMMMQVYLENRHTTVYEYYNSGEVKRISNLQMVHLTKAELKKSTSKYKYKAVTESEQYFDKSGKEISVGEYLEILKTDSPTNLSENSPNDLNPVYPGGMEAMLNFLKENIVYPNKEKRKRVSGTSYISFVVEKDGRVTDVKVIKGMPNGEGCDNEAIRVIKLMPNWKPAEKNGELVKSNQVIPIKFQLLSPPQQP